MKLLLSAHAMRVWGTRIAAAVPGGVDFITAEDALAAGGACEADIAFMTREVTGASSKNNPTAALVGFDAVRAGRVHNAIGAWQAASGGGDGPGDGAVPELAALYAKRRLTPFAEYPPAWFRALAPAGRIELAATSTIDSPR